MHAGFSKNMAKHPLHILSYLLYSQSKHRLFSRVDFSAGSTSQPVLRLFSRIDFAAGSTTFQPDRLCSRFYDFSAGSTLQPVLRLFSRIDFAAACTTFQPTCSHKIYYFNDNNFNNCLRKNKGIFRISLLCWSIYLICDFAILKFCGAHITHI